jgi:FkbM family methyltransferase
MIRKLGKTCRLVRNRKFRFGLSRGIAAAIEHQGVLAPLNVHTVVDVGANVGQFSLLAWSLFPAANIFAFEPQPGPARAFARTFSRIPTVTLFESAIGKHSGNVRMHVSRRHDSSSLLPISRRMVDIFPGTEELAMIDVPIAELDCFLDRGKITGSALLKIDVQGSELEVLSGCEALLNSFSYVYIELSFVELYSGQALCHEVIRYLDERDFFLQSVNNLVIDRSGRPIQADFLFARGSLRHSRIAISGENFHDSLVPRRQVG